MSRQHFGWPSRLLTALFALIAAAVISGCAAQNAYRDGQQLLDRGDAAAAMAKLQEATLLEPRSAVYRLAYLQIRERLIASALKEADTLFAQDRMDEAERAYRQVLVLDPSHERASASLKTIDAHRRHETQLRTAEEAWGRKDAVSALGLVRTVLLEAPNDRRALALKRRIEDETAKPAIEPKLAAAYQKPLTVEFKDAPLRTIFEVISRTAGLNFVFDKDVRLDQKTSIFVRNSSTEGALQTLLLTNQLERRVLDANSILIYPSTPAKLKDYQSQSVRSFYLANADAKVVANTLKAITKTRDIVVDERLNLVIMRDAPEALRIAEKLVALHDVPEPEVMLEVEILEVKRSRLLDLGVRLPEQVALTVLPSTSGGTLTVDDLRNVSGSRIGASVGAVTIQANKVVGDTNILANPRIRARNREKAKILIGDRVPNISTTATATGFVSESVTYVDVGLKLDVEPVIYPEDEVVMKIALEVSNIVNQVQTKSGTLAYQIGTRTASTVLRLRDGENQVLAGLINDEDRRTARRLPGLGDVPIVGRLFGSQSDDSTKTEIVLSITPRVLRNVPKRYADEMEFEAGTEGNLSQRSVSLGSTPAPASPAASPQGPGTATSQPQAVLPNVGSPVGAPVGLSGTANQSPATNSIAPGAAAPPAAVPEPTTAGGGSSQTPSAPRPASLAWQAPTEARVGQTLSLQLLVQSSDPLSNVPLTITFDPRALQIVGVQEGSFMRQGGGVTQFSSRVDTAGAVSISIARSGGTGASGSGVLASLAVRPTTPSSQVALQIAPMAGTRLDGQPLTLQPPAPLLINIGP